MVSFDASWWVEKLRSLGYPVSSVELDVDVLAGDRFLPRDLGAVRALRLYADGTAEVAVVEVPLGGLTRGRCVRAARMWKERTLGVRPLLAFTDGEESFAVIVPGAGTGGEAKVLWLSSDLYRTDLDVLASISYPGSDSFSKAYDAHFFPYEKVREEFFEGYRDLYGKVLESVRPVVGGEAQGYAQRWLGRLMFLYFLQRKGWLRGDRNYISGIGGYLELNKLYYEALCEGTQTPDIPYLNGTLFEKEGWLTPEVEGKLVPVMEPLLEEVRSFFGGYNFTVDESSPMEVDVSIDPALIGTVFENMLPEYERGGKGVFYTQPREIQFICRRALAYWLNSPDKVEEQPDGKLVFRDGIDHLVDRLGAERKDKEIRDCISRLKDARIVDPAVGSGGFLLGMMLEIVALIKRLESIVGEDTPQEDLKIEVLKNLYGFDIEPEAIEIAMLRLWLSLVIDREHPRPLPNINRNLVIIKDSLQQGEKKQQKLGEDYTAADPRLASHNALHWLYLNEHDGAKKRMYLEQLQALNEQFHRETGVDWDIIEFYMHGLADIVVMNPPYIRQESIPEAKKAYYVSAYGLEKKSDLFAYFVMRAHNLLAPGGVASVITSDKWLETGYGVSLQKAIRPYLVAVYGQKERSFGADINTVISVYSRARMMDPVSFTYIERYGEPRVRRSTRIERRKLEPGKWFYLRAPKVFMEKILPRLTHRLGDFAEIKFGIKTGANDFFYMKDITHLYETDRFANPLKFEEWGVKARTQRDLKREGLIYIENEGGERFVIDKKDVTPLIRSPRQLEKYSIPLPTTLCLNTDSPGKMTSQYITHGKKLELPKRPSLRTHKPWFKVTDLLPSRILLIKSAMETFYVPLSKTPIICDQRLYPLNCKDPDKVWLYLTSTQFLLTAEIYCRRLGGGASDIAVEDYQEMPVPPLSELRINYNPEMLLGREPLRYYEEIKQKDRKELDMAVLTAMGFDKPDKLLPEVYQAFIDIVEDRLIKADRPLRTTRQENTAKGELIDQ
jgi:hypothetical protein